LHGAVCNFIDITERKRSEEARQLLLRELNHRVKNLFSIASGMVGMTARSSQSPADMARTLTGRLTALARAHELIRPAVTTDLRYTAAATLGELAEAVLSPYRPAEDSQVFVQGPKVEIGPTGATAFALVMHELATNAAKYGALSTSEGQVDISWGVLENQLVLRWNETGGPVIAGSPQRTGFGSQLAQVAARGQLGGSISFDWQYTGVRVVLTAAIDRLRH
jgi:two-component sensor histidine kinase